MEPVTATAEATPQTQTPAVETPARGKQPTATEFALIWNESTSRQDAVKRFNEKGYHMTYGALVARVKAYTNPDRAGGPIALKSMPAATRGRRINTNEVNAAIAAATATDAVKGEGEAEKPA